MNMNKKIPETETLAAVTSFNFNGYYNERMIHIEQGVDIDKPNVVGTLNLNKAQAAELICRLQGFINERDGL